MKSTPIAILLAAVIISATLLIVTTQGRASPSSDSAASKENVTIADNVQTIELRAKGGYFPRRTVAKAGIPTVLRVNTAGTYDCSASIRIPSLSVAQLLPANGSSDIALGTPSAGTVNGTCGMGMYNFQIQFQ